MKFRVHYTGDWTRSDCNTAATREDPTVKEYGSLADMNEYDRKQFEWMLDIGERVMSSGAYVWQIQY